MKLLSNVMLDPDLVLPVPVIVVEDEPLIQTTKRNIIRDWLLTRKSYFCQTLARLMSN
jgi:hypothetical protein